MSSSKTPHVIGMSPDEAVMTSLLLLVGKSVHVPGNLSRGSYSKWNAKANALVGSHFN